MMRLPRSFAFGVSMLLTCGHGTAWAADFSSIAESAAVLYDAPSAKAKKLYVIGHGYPVEVIVVIDRWVKIRDAGGRGA